MKCPHCTVDFHVEEKNIYIDKDQEGIWAVAVCRCSACQKLVIRLLSARDLNRAWEQAIDERTSRLVRPKAFPERTLLGSLGIWQPRSTSGLHIEPGAASGDNRAWGGSAVLTSVFELR